MEHAHAACEGIDRGNLVSIHDFDENNIVMALIEAKTAQTYVWIGLQCTGSCSSFSDSSWTDGTPLDYTKAFRKNDNAMCAMVTKDHTSIDDYWDNKDQVHWYFKPCDEPIISICKVKIQ